MNQTVNNLLETRKEIANRIAERNSANKVDNEALTHIDAVIALYNTNGETIATTNGLTIEVTGTKLREQVIEYIKRGGVFVTINDIVDHLKPYYPDKNLVKFKKQISNILSTSKDKEGLVYKVIKTPNGAKDSWGELMWLDGKKVKKEHIKKEA